MLSSVGVAAPPALPSPPAPFGEDEDEVRGGTGQSIYSLASLYSAVTSVQWIVCSAVSNVQCAVFSVPCEVCSVQCEVYSVDCTVCSVKCKVCSVQCAVYSVPCEVCSVQCEVYSVDCTVCSVKCKVCSVQCAVYSVQCTVCSVQYVSQDYDYDYDDSGAPVGRAGEGLAEEINLKLVSDAELEALYDKRPGGGVFQAIDGSVH